MGSSRVHGAPQIPSVYLNMVVLKSPMICTEPKPFLHQQHMRPFHSARDPMSRTLPISLDPHSKASLSKMLWAGGLSEDVEDVQLVTASFRAASAD